VERKRGEAFLVKQSHHHHHCLSCRVLGAVAVSIRSWEEHLECVGLRWGGAGLQSVGFVMCKRMW
jgi:hypothetical protein